MNILFLTIGRIESLQDGTIYSDLLAAFVNKGHNVCAVCPNERRYKKGTEYTENDGFSLLKVKTGNLQKCNILEKGISTLAVEGQYKRAIKKYLGDKRFDLVLYSTPPITLVNVIKYIKKRDGAKSYLMLKDIFPQNAVDMEMMSKGGLLYRYFRAKEKKLYALSDVIGCMSAANAEYVLSHNKEISADRVEQCPNCLKPEDVSVNDREKRALRDKYGIPQESTVFVYGGNLGKPQGIPFIKKCLHSMAGNKNVFFLIVGNGTEYGVLEQHLNANPTPNVKLMSALPKAEYDSMISACDVGLIFLDHRFTIPNFPSRLLSYMQASLPVIACTDTATDIGKVITEGGFGWWCESNDLGAFCSVVESALSADRVAMGNAGHSYLNTHYTADIQYGIIAKHFEALNK